MGKCSFTLLSPYFNTQEKENEKLKQAESKLEITLASMDTSIKGLATNIENLSAKMTLLLE